jgi:hypothetical protein
MNPNITFRQVSGFHFDKVEYFIIFNFFGLTNAHLDLDLEYYFIMDLHLIFKEGEKETSVSHPECSLNNIVNPT